MMQFFTPLYCPSSAHSILMPFPHTILWNFVYKISKMMYVSLHYLWTFVCAFLNKCQDTAYLILHQTKNNYF
jgi:hypothetical protein